MSTIERQQKINTPREKKNNFRSTGIIFRFALGFVKNKVLEAAYNPESSFTLAGFNPCAVTVAQVRDRHNDRNIGDTLEDFIQKGNLKHTRKIFTQERIDPNQFYYLGNGYDYTATRKEQPIFVKVDDNPQFPFEYYFGTEGIVNGRVLTWEQVSTTFLSN